MGIPLTKLEVAPWEALTLTGVLEALDNHLTPPKSVESNLL